MTTHQNPSSPSIRAIEAIHRHASPHRLRSGVLLVRSGELLCGDVGRDRPVELRFEALDDRGRDVLLIGETAAVAVVDALDVLGADRRHVEDQQDSEEQRGRDPFVPDRVCVHGSDAARRGDGGTSCVPIPRTGVEPRCARALHSKPHGRLRPPHPRAVCRRGVLRLARRVRRGARARRRRRVRRLLRTRRLLARHPHVRLGVPDGFRPARDRGRDSRRRCAHVSPRAVRPAGDRIAPRLLKRSGRRVVEAYFDFDTDAGRAHAASSVLARCDAEGPQAWLLLTALQELHGFEEQIGDAAADRRRVLAQLRRRQLARQRAARPASTPTATPRC